jgi:iron complex outermembrane receptor protein
MHEKVASDDLTELSLEALMDLEVTSVSRKAQTLANTAAAAFVITQEDIRRSGATTIPDLLRLVPGVQVARIDSNKWAVSIRGGNGRFSSKLQVLKDGRSIYTPLFSGTFWETVDTPLEDIERIEVIRGPGAAMWGANAVNGVINIITKHAEETKGGLLSGGYGNTEKGFGTVRFGQSLAPDTFLRLYGKHSERGEGEYRNGTKAHDDWYLSSGGFRLDAQPSANDTLTLQGDYYNGRYNETYTLYRLPTVADPGYNWIQPAISSAWGGNLLARWQRTFSDTDNLSLQLNYDHYQRDFFILGEKRNTVDIDFQHRFSLGSRQEVLWGLGYRYSHDTVNNSQILTLTETSKGINLFSAFLQDEITLLPNVLSLILGSRFEHNDYTGFEIQPNGRLIWTPSPQHTEWGSISRAVRTPSRIERYLQYRYMTIPPDPPSLPMPMRVEITGNQNFKSETLLAYELGYRAEMSKSLSFDLSLFFNQYERLRVRQEGTPEPEPPTYTNLVLRYPLSNDAHGYSYGAELGVTFIPYDWWRLQAGYHYLRTILYLDNGSTDYINRSNAADGAPRHQLTLRSGFDLGKQVELDLWLRAVDRVKYIDQISIPGYVAMDARIAWHPVHDLELAVVGQNLFQRRHQEYISETINTIPSEIPRSIYGKVTWKF